MSSEPEKYFFADRITPGKKLDVALICRSLKLTNVALVTVPKHSGTVRIDATVDDTKIPIAYLSKKCPQKRLNIELSPQQMSITMESTGSIPVDVIGYVHDVDVASLIAIRNQIIGSPPEALPFEPFSVEGFQRIGDYIRYKDVAVGTGLIPIRGQRVRISYKIKLPNGYEIDSEDKSNHYLPVKRKVPVAVAKVCPGVDKVLQTMREGGERIAVIRPEYGFGEKGSPKAGIPPNSTFYVDIKLVKCF